MNSILEKIKQREQTVIKKGTKIKLWWCCNIHGSDDKEIIVLKEDTNIGELDEMARELMENDLAPCWGHEVIE